MNPAILNTPFVQVALPIMVTFIAAAWLNGKRFDDLRTDMNRRFDEIIKRLDRIENLLPITISESPGLKSAHPH